MRIAVIGAGIVGMTAAWALARDGHRVTVIDGAAEPAAGASHANGAQLSYSYVSPLASPAVWPELGKLVWGRDAPVRFRPGFDPFQYRWALQFLRACTREEALATTRAHLQLAELSRRTLAAAGLDEAGFDFSVNGKLVVYSDGAAMAGARALMQFQNALSVSDDARQQALTAEECLKLEPALTSIAGRLKGGIYSPKDAVADPWKLCRHLRGRLEAAGASFRFGQPVKRFIRQGARIVALDLGDEQFEADRYLLAAGNDSRRLAKSAGLDLPIYPVRGYSLTLATGGHGGAPRVSVTDYANKIVYAPLGDRLRIAGMADIAGSSMALDPARMARFVAQAKATFPAAADEAAWSAITPWAGLRPATPGGRPILGPSGIEKLWLAAGHGGLGLTLAFGSAALLADQMAGRRPALDPALFAYF